MEKTLASTVADTTTFQPPHVAVCYSAGMGHLAPCLSLASALSSSPYNCRVTLVIIVPIVSAAESQEISSFFSSHPHIHRLDFHLDLASPNPHVDPFLIRYATISRSAHLLARPLSSLSPTVLAVFSEITLTMGLNTTLPPTIQNYTIIPTSARFFSFMAFLPRLLDSPPLPQQNFIEVPGIGLIPRENIPPPFLLPDHPMADLIASNARHLHMSKGILLNTFDSFESETLVTLKAGSVVPHLPPMYPVGPLQKVEWANRVHLEQPLVKGAFREGTFHEELLLWLDDQPNDSVIYVSFGSRTTMSRDQLRELGRGLKRSGGRFLWVVKSTVVDVEEKEGLEDLLGEELYESLLCDGKGKLVKRWVRQEEILGHRAVGGFVSHCGWNSVMEAAQRGVPILAWPQGGDQRENSGVVEKVGLGVWERAWGVNSKVVGEAEIAEKVEVVMATKDLRKSAKWIGEEAKRACEVGGSSRTALLSIVESLKHC